MCRKIKSKGATKITKCVELQDSGKRHLNNISFATISCNEGISPSPHIRIHLAQIHQAE